MAPVVAAAVIGAVGGLVGSLLGTVVGPWLRERATRTEQRNERRRADRRTAYYDMHRELRLAVNAMADRGSRVPEDIDETLKEAVDNFEIIASPKVHEKARAVWDTIAREDGLFVARGCVEAVEQSRDGDAEELREAVALLSTALGSSRKALTSLMTAMKDELDTNR